MKLKKKYYVLLVAILTMSLFVGCATEELSFYKTYKELNALMLSEPLHSEGKVSFTVDTLPMEMIESSMDASELEMTNELITFINDNSFVYTMDSDVQNKKAVVQLDLRSNSSDEALPLFTVIRNVDTTYVKLDDYVDAIANIVSHYGSEEDVAEFNDAMYEIVGENEYISISDEELITFYAGMLSSSMGQEQADVFMEQITMQLEPEYQKEYSELYFSFLDQMLEKVYTNYSLDIVQKEDNNRYSMTFDADNIGETAIGFMDYSIENNQTLVNTLNTFLTNLSDEEYSMLVGAYAMDMVSKKMLTEELESMSDDLTENKEAYKAQLQDVLEIYNSMYKAYIQGSKLQITYGKNNDVITRDLLFKIQVNDPETQSVTFDATMTVNETYEAIKPFDVEVPTEHVFVLTEYLKSMPKTMQIYIDDGMYTMVNFEKGKLSGTGYMSAVIRDGVSYLPAQVIADEFGETIGWDNTLEKPYIVNGVINVYFDDFIVENAMPYVKVKEFEKIGYTIGWDEDLRLITIEK